MGTDRLSVVDPETMGVRGLERLRVVDASVFPFVTNGNIYAPVMMVAEKAADLVLGNTPLTPTPVDFIGTGSLTIARKAARTRWSQPTSQAWLPTPRLNAVSVLLSLRMTIGLDRGAEFAAHCLGAPLPLLPFPVIVEACPNRRREDPLKGWPSHRGCLLRRRSSRRLSLKRAQRRVMTPGRDVRRRLSDNLPSGRVRSYRGRAWFQSSGERVRVNPAVPPVWTTTTLVAANSRSPSIRPLARRATIRPTVTRSPERTSASAPSPSPA